MSQDQEVTLRVFNSKQKLMRLILEPWGETFPFKAETELAIIISGPKGGSPEIDVGDDSVTVFGWAGSTAKVFKNGKELGAVGHERTRVPQMP